MDGYTLYFYVAGYGVILCSVNFVIIYSLDYFNVPSELLSSFGVSWREVNGKNPPLIKYDILKPFCYSIFAVFFTYFCAKLYSLFVDRTSRYKYQLSLEAAESSDFENLLFSAMTHYRQVCITLNCNKVYVGNVYNFDPMRGRIEYITILPLLSGYRGSKKKNIKFTTNYWEHYKRKIGDSADDSENSEMKSMMQGFLIVIPAKDIDILSNFDIEAYKDFLKSDFKSHSYAVPEVGTTSVTINTQQG